MPSIVEVRVCDALSPEDAASLEKDDAPLTPKPPKDFTVSFAESVTRTANVYASSRPPSRRGVSGKEHTRFTSRAQKDATETSAKLDSRRFGGSLPSALERDPALRRVHEEARAARLMAKTYKARMQVAEKAAETYRTKSFAAELRASRVAADAKKLFGRSSSERLSFDTLDVDPGKALARLAKEREASRTKLEQYEQELRSLRRANETLRRARDADRKTFFFEKKVFTQRLADAAATSASLREETARGRHDARRLALEVRTLEARLFRPEPPAGPDATKRARANARAEPALEPAPAPAPNLSPRRVREEEEEAEEAEEEDADTEDVVPVMEESHSLNPALSGSSSGGGEADAPHVVLCVVCVEPESLPAPPGASSAESAESAESVEGVEGVEGVESADVSHERRVSSGASLSPSLSRLSEDDAPDAPESPGDASVTDEQTTNASPSDAAPRRDRFFFARTTVASRSRAETLSHHRALA